MLVLHITLYMYEANLRGAGWSLDAFHSGCQCCSHVLSQLDHWLIDYWLEEPVGSVSLEKVCEAASDGHV